MGKNSFPSASANVSSYKTATKSPTLQSGLDGTEKKTSERLWLVLLQCHSASAMTAPSSGSHCRTGSCSQQNPVAPATGKSRPLLPSTNNWLPGAYLPFLWQNNFPGFPPCCPRSLGATIYHAVVGDTTARDPEVKESDQTRASLCALHRGCSHDPGRPAATPPRAVAAAAGAAGRAPAVPEPPPQPAPRSPLPRAVRSAGCR